MPLDGNEEGESPAAVAAAAAEEEEETVEMNREDRSRLLRCRKQIVEDLEVRVVNDFLLENRVLDRQALQEIEAEVGQEKARAFAIRQF